MFILCCAIFGFILGKGWNIKTSLTGCRIHVVQVSGLLWLLVLLPNIIMLQFLPLRLPALRFLHVFSGGLFVG
jgi:hypothetical protein